MQGMGLAPLVVLATTGQNALMLAAAVALLLTPSRMLACLLSRLLPLRDEEPAQEELQKKLLPRALVYSGSAAVVYLAGVSHPERAVRHWSAEPWHLPAHAGGGAPADLPFRPCAGDRAQGRFQGPAHHGGLCAAAAPAGLVLREWLALGTVFGVPQLSRPVCPWPGCRQAALSCWACCAPSGARWPANARNT